MSRNDTFLLSADLARAQLYTLACPPGPRCFKQPHSRGQLVSANSLKPHEAKINRSYYENTKGKTVPVSDETELEVAEEKNEDKPKKKPVRLTAEKIKEINDAMQNGCGKLELGKPFTIGGTEYTELEYDFKHKYEF